MYYQTIFKVFIVGGACYSEMRAAYEVSTEKRNWEIVMGKIMTFNVKCNLLFNNIQGGTHIMTPEEFLETVKEVAGNGDDEE